MGRSGSGSVGKGGREGNYAPPVDQYRKRIARQDSRKEKSHLKEVKHAQETKDVAPKAVKQIVSYIYLAKVQEWFLKFLKLLYCSVTVEYTNLSNDII